MTAPTLAGFADVLQGFGVDVGDPDRRLAKARTLLEAGLCIEDAELVFMHIEATSDAQKVPRIVAALALEPRRLLAAVADARAYAEAKAAREAAKKAPDRAFGDKPYTPGPLPDEEPVAWQRERQARAAFCLVVTEKKQARAVANELGVSLAEMPALIARGRVIQGVTEVAAKRQELAEGETQEDRIKRFRAEMKKNQLQQTPR